jgi:hypothetical protein
VMGVTVELDFAPPIRPQYLPNSVTSNLFSTRKINGQPKAFFFASQ